MIARFRFGGLCLLALITVSHATRAQTKPAKPPIAATTDRARTLHVEGARLFEQGKYEQAYAAFLAAYALKKHPQIAGNLAECEAKLGKYRDAAEHFSVVANDTHEALPGEKRLAARRLQDVQAKIGTLTIVVDAAGAEVLIDDVSIGRAPLSGPVFVEPGARRILARMAGRPDAAKSLVVEPAMVRTVSLSMSAAAPPLPPTMKRPIWPAMVSGGLAVVGIAVGAGLTAAANGKRGEADALRAKLAPGGVVCTSSPAASVASSCTAFQEAAASRDALSNGALVGFVAGGAFAVATTALVAWAATGPKDAKRAGATLRIAPVIGTNQRGLAIEGAW